MKQILKEGVPYNISNPETDNCTRRNLVAFKFKRNQNKYFNHYVASFSLNNFNIVN